jgi:hypothetical protein
MSAYPGLFGLPLQGNPFGLDASENSETVSTQHQEIGFIFAPASPARLSADESISLTSPDTPLQPLVSEQARIPAALASPTTTITQEAAGQQNSITQLPAQETSVEDAEALQAPPEAQSISRCQRSTSNDPEAPAEVLQATSPTRHDSPAEAAIFVPRSGKRKRQYDDEAVVESPPTKRRRRMRSLGSALIPARRYSL